MKSVDWKQFRKSKTAAFLVLLGIVTMIYGRSLGNDFVIWDDDSLVYENPLTQEMTMKNVWGAFTSYDPELYVPLTIMSFQLEHAVVGFNPFFFHVNNLLLHTLAAFLVLLLLERWGASRRSAIIAALVFAIHPVNTEAVAWVSARKDLLAAVFSLSSIHMYLSYRREGLRRFFWMAFGFFFFALLSKPIAIVLPLIFILCDWKDSGLVRRDDWKQKIPFFALSILFLVVGLFGKQRNIGALSIFETVLLAAKSTIFSLQTYFWPVNLSVIYLQTDPVSPGLPQFFVPVLLLLFSTALIALTMRRTRLIAFCAMMYIIFLVPSFSNFAKDDIYYFSDRYIYLSQIGLLLPLALLIDRIWHRLIEPPLFRMTAGVLAAAILVSLSVTAYAQSLLWVDSETLYRDALNKNSRSVTMHYNLAVLEHERGNREAALLEYQKAVNIDPLYAKARANLGVFYQEEKNIPKAIEELHRAIDSDPTAAEPHNTLGIIYIGQGKTEAGIAEFRTAIALRETYAQAHINLASALGSRGRYEEGLREYKRAFELAPQLLDGLPEVRKALESLR